MVPFKNVLQFLLISAHDRIPCNLVSKYLVHLAVHQGAGGMLVTGWIKHFPQHMKLHHCSYISMSFLQHILWARNLLWCATKPLYSRIYIIVAINSNSLSILQQADMRTNPKWWAWLTLVFCFPCGIICFITCNDHTCPKCGLKQKDRISRSWDNVD